MSLIVDMDALSAAVERSLVGHVLDGMSLPADTRLLADVLGTLIYERKKSVDLSVFSVQVQQAFERNCGGE